MTSDPPVGSLRLWTLRAALLVEALALLVAGLAGLALLLTGGWSVLTLALALVALAVAAGLVAGQRAVQHGHPRATAPLVTWQLLQGATALAVLGAVTDRTPLAVLVVAWAAVGLAGLVVVLLIGQERRREPRVPAEP